MNEEQTRPQRSNDLKNHKNYLLEPLRSCLELERVPLRDFDLIFSAFWALSASMRTQCSPIIIEKGIRIKYPYNFGNSDFGTIWLEFDLLVRTIVQSKGYKR